MKLVRSAFFLLLLLMGGGTAMGQITEETVEDTLSNTYDFDNRKLLEERTTEALNKVIQYAMDRKYDSFGKMMAYVGRDPIRNMRSMINPLDPHEAITIENSCNYIYKWLSESALHHAKDFRIVKGAYSDMFFWNVEFTLLNGKTKTLTFLFIELDNKILFCQATKA